MAGNLSSELPAEYNNHILFESEARTVRNYESLFVPGLLQTEDYARATQGTLPLATDEQVEDEFAPSLSVRNCCTNLSPRCASSWTKPRPSCGGKACHA